MHTKVKPKRLTVTRAALLLGVTRPHLSYVLHGHRKSRSLMRRYRALKKEAA